MKHVAFAEAEIKKSALDRACGPLKTTMVETRNMLGAECLRVYSLIYPKLFSMISSKTLVMKNDF